MNSEQDPNTFPLREESKTIQILIFLNNLEERIWSDRTEKLPTKGRLGGKYIMIVFTCDSNSILEKYVSSKNEHYLNKTHEEH